MPGRTILIDGVRFISKRPGVYISENERWALVHMMKGTPHEQWELWSYHRDLVDATGDLDTLIDEAPCATDIVAHARMGHFSLEDW